jgi:hypothetical protein
MKSDVPEEQDCEGIGTMLNEAYTGAEAAVEQAQNKLIQAKKDLAALEGKSFQSLYPMWITEAEIKVQEAHKALLAESDLSKLDEDMAWDGDGSGTV